MSTEPPYPNLDVRITLSEDEAWKFLDSLADEDFRTRLESDPGGVLREHGIELSPESVPDKVVLPKPEQIEDFVGACKQGSYLGPEPHDVLGFAILHIVFGAMPLVASRE